MRVLNESTSPLLRRLSLAQTVLLPLSLTPSILPRLSWIGSRYHSEITVAHLTIFGVAFLTLRKVAKTSGTDVPIVEILRWALPELIAGAVEIQRRGERDVQKNLGDLERMRYDLKGA